MPRSFPRWRPDFPPRRARTSPLRRRARRSLLLVGALLAASFLAAPAASAETLPLPLSGSTHTSGRGYGHGHGLSQWGAYGAATKGLTHQQILGHYYPGTTLATNPASIIRVRLSGVSSSAVTVMMMPGLQLDTGTSVIRLGGGTASEPVDRWRLLATSTGQTLQWRVNGVWKSSGSYRNLTGTVDFLNSTSDTVRVARTDGLYREYPDRVQSVWIDSSNSLMTVNMVWLEKYLNGVVPNEMPASWPAAALRAQ